MTAQRFYSILVSTAIASGVSSSLITAGFTAQAGHVRNVNHSVRGSAPTSNQAVTDLWNKADNLGCSYADTKLEMDPGTCSNFMNPCSNNTCMTLCCVEQCIDDDEDPETPCVTQQITTYNIDFSFEGAWTPQVQ